ncbi:MAG TPA: aspartate kinase [Ktedonobacteraceae bacterium]|nr:aspartate kinase [Ktedonobacteraceae bacterium]
MDNPVSILKFGGTSVGTGERIRHVAHIIEKQLHDREENFPVVVVSAMSGVTDQLLRIAHHAWTHEHDAREQELHALKQRHLEAACKAVHNPEKQRALLHDLEATFTSLEQDIAKVASRNLQESETGKLNTALYGGSVIAAWGERLSVLLLAAAVCDINVQAAPVRREIIITGHPKGQAPTSPASVVGAEPLSEETRANAQALLSPFLEHRTVPIAAGFIGRTKSGIVTTLGRNGSDYSASVIGAALDCSAVSIYTDVDGILTADPRIVPNARLLPELSYSEAARLSWFGAKVLHPRTLMPLAHRNIPVHVRNTFHPHRRGTIVGPEGRSSSAARAIAIRRHLALITVESTAMFGIPENAAQVFALAARAGAAPVAICSSSGYHLSFLVEEQAGDSVVALLQHDTGNWRVLCRRGLAACACIGSGFTVSPMSPARAISALAHERIPVVAQGVSEGSIILIIEDEDTEPALRSLHRDLIAPVIPLVRSHTEEKHREVI